MRVRLDVELVRRGLARSREHAAELIQAGSVLVKGIPASKAATAVDAETSITVNQQGDEYVSRGGHKLAGALDIFSEITLNDVVALDAGASTGGFTDVLLRRGVKKVYAVDVGYGQLAWQLQKDPRVVIHDRTNVRAISPVLISEAVDLVVADLSFISLNLVLPSLISVAKHTADFLLMVKPQFEVGRENLGAGGVVREKELRVAAVYEVAKNAKGLGLGTVGVVASPLPGPSGNVEYFLWLRMDKAVESEAELKSVIAEAVERGPH